MLHLDDGQMSLVRRSRAGDGRPRSRGQALAEFALVFPIFMLVMVGIFDVGRAVYAYNTVSNAARVGGRVASVNQIYNSVGCDQTKPIQSLSNPKWSVVACAAQSAVSLGIAPVNVVVSYASPPGKVLSCSAGALSVGCLATVTVTYTYTPVTPIIGNLIGSITISSASQVEIENVFP
jgi:Flp pilus assembly protein TadG